MLASGWPVQWPADSTVAVDSTVVADSTVCSIDTDHYFSRSDLDRTLYQGFDRHFGDNMLPDGELVA